MPWQAVTVAAFGAVWLLGRGRPRSERFMRATELIGLSVTASGAILMCFQISYLARPDAILLLSLSYTLIVRAIMVPNSARRTLLYGVLLFVPFVVSVYFIHYLGHDPSIYTQAADARLHLDAATIARRWTMVDALWWIAAIGIMGKYQPDGIVRAVTPAALRVLGLCPGTAQRERMAKARKHSPFLSFLRGTTSAQQADDVSWVFRARIGERDPCPSLLLPRPSRCSCP